MFQGSIDRTGKVSLSWDTQEEKLYSPDGLKHLLPCESCGQPQWVSLPTVSVMCEICYAFPSELDERILWGNAASMMYENGELVFVLLNKADEQWFRSKRYYQSIPEHARRIEVESDLERARR